MPLPPRPVPFAARGALACVFVAALLWPGTTALAGPRPDFSLPFACGEQWRLTTYPRHKPEDKKLDFLRFGGSTEGSQVRVSAPGRVRELIPAEGGVEVRHAGGWFTLYLHMRVAKRLRAPTKTRDGTLLRQGDVIGTVSDVSTKDVDPHLHYEQLYDYTGPRDRKGRGDGDGENDEIVHPVLQGRKYRLRAYEFDPVVPLRLKKTVFPIVTSDNACPGPIEPEHRPEQPGLPGGAPPPPPAPPTATPLRQYWVDTFADAVGYTSPTCSGGDLQSPRCRPQGTLRAGRNYVFCKVRGARVGSSSAYNHWWLLTDLDVVHSGASGRAYVSAYYLTRWGNDVAKDNDGREIPDC